MFPLEDSIPNRITPIATFAILASNVLVFLLCRELAAPQLERFFLDWGLVPARVASGDRLPFLTSQFLHGGVVHLVGNLWTLWIFGPNVEERMGPWRFVAFYLLVGVVAGLVHVGADPRSALPTIGASGAVAGVMGAYLLLFPRAQILFVVPIFFYPLFFVWPAATYLLYWFALQFLSGTVSHLARGDALTGGVAWWAHVGGVGAGILVSRLFLRRPRTWALPANHPSYLYRGH